MVDGENIQPLVFDNGTGMVKFLVGYCNVGGVIDQNRTLVDAPAMVRSQMNFKRLSFTDIKIDIKRVPKKKTLIAALRGRKLIVQKRRAALNGFDRFKLMLAKIKRVGVVRQELAKLKKETAA